MPVLWDKKDERIVNNESEDIMRMLCRCFNDYLDNEEKKRLEFYPEAMRGSIDDVSVWKGPNLNAGVYKAGFAETQQVYEKNARTVLKTLDLLENLLKESGSLFVIGNKMTTIDIKLYTTPCTVRRDISRTFQAHGAEHQAWLPILASLAKEYVLERDRGEGNDQLQAYQR